jgi:hypothetical protein
MYDQGMGCQILSSGYSILGNINPCGLCIKSFDYILLDTLGNIINENTYSLHQEAWSEILHKSRGDTLLVLGRILNPNYPAYDLFIKKIDKAGSLIWEKQIVSDILADHIIVQSICNTIDSSYFILYSVNDTGIRYMKLNNNGDSLYAIKFGLPFYSGISMTELHDGGFAILGYKQNSGIFDYCILRLDANGDTLWTIDFPKDTIGVIFKIVETKDHGFALLGNLIDSINHHPCCLFKFDSVGTFLWSKPFYTSNIQDFYEVRNCSDNGFIVAGSSIDPGHLFSHCFLYRSDSNGDSLWFKEYELAFGGGFEDVQQTPDNGFLAVGTLGNPGYPPSIFVVKTDSMGNVTSTLGLDQIKVKGEINIFPNPASNFVTLSLPFDENNFYFSIFDAMGRNIFSKDLFSENNLSINVSDFSEGIYFICVYHGEKVYRNKLIVK